MEVSSRKFSCFLKFMYLPITKFFYFLIYRFSPDEGPLISVIHQRQVKMYFHLKIQVSQRCRCYQWFLHLKQILLATTCQLHLPQPVRQQGIFLFSLSVFIQFCISAQITGFSTSNDLTFFLFLG